MSRFCRARRAVTGAAASIAAASLCAALSGCLTAPIVPPTGWVFTNLKAPLDPDMQDSRVEGKVGRAATHSVLGLVAWGDAGTSAAAAEGGIAVVTHADYELFSILGIYQRYTTVVYGQ